MKSVFLKNLLVLCAVSCGAASANAFSLAGARADWHTPELGYNAPFVAPSTAGPGPVNFHEEYRWNVPIITYAFTPRFISYFGQKGVQEVEKALKVLSDLGDLSAVDIDNFPLMSARINYRAQQVGIYDLKSRVIGFMLTQYGLGVPSLYVNTTRKRWVENGTTNYLIVRRNFDPVTYLPTPYINGQLWTYIGISEAPMGGYITVANTVVDPLAYEGLPAANFSWPGGIYLTGLTRDDVGGLKYIYNRTNINFETLQPGSALGGTGGGVSQVGGGGSGVWVPIPGTNTTGTTNVVVGGNTNLIDQALRPGINRFQFARLNFDSTLGVFIPATVNWTDRYVTNGIQRTQQLSRQLTDTPDLLFGSADVSGGPADANVFLGTVSTWESYVNTATIIEINTGDGGVAGPGVINGPRFLIFNDSALTAVQNATPATLDEFGAASAGIIWGTFDGTTNEPVVYPLGTKISDIEYLNFGDTTIVIQ